MTANLPTMPVWDLKFTKNPHDLVLATHGRGFWIFDNIQPLEQWSHKVSKSDFHLFAASGGTEWQKYFGRHIGPTPSDFVAPNPPSGPVISYYLKSALGGGKSQSHKPVTIKVSDSDGNHVATFHGPGKAGVNRIAWNMRYDGAQLPKFLKGNSFFGGGSGPSGPIALPGTYEVTVTAGKHTEKEKVQVRSDPRKDTPTDVQKKALKAGLQLRGDTNAAVTMLERTRNMLKILGNVLDSTSGADKGSDKAAAHAAAKSLKKRLGGFVMHLYNPKVQYSVPEDGLHHISRFGHELLSAYRQMGHMGPAQAPNAEQMGYVKKLQGELTRYLAQFNGKLHDAVVAYNKKAYKAGVQTLPVGKPVTTESSSMH